LKAGGKLRKTAAGEKVRGIRYCCKYRKGEWIKWRELVGTVRKYALTAKSNGVI
jgi:hypothetical protein